MDKLPATRSTLRKEKKKKAKGEIDRIKQAEKKKRRLEKALATSAAIRSELEKKKQKKMEEQQRLDEEGAAIAESVALLVLGGEDSDCRHDPAILNCCEGLNILSDTITNSTLPMSYPHWKLYSFDSIGHVSDGGYTSGFSCNGPEIGWGFPAAMNRVHPQKHYAKETTQGQHLLTSIRSSSQSTSAIEVADDLHEGDLISDRGTGGYLLNTMIGGHYMRNEVNFYQEY